MFGYFPVALPFYFLYTIDPLSNWMRKKLNEFKKIVMRAHARVAIVTTLIMCILVLWLIFHPIFKGNLYAYGMAFFFPLSFLLLYYILKDRAISFWTLCFIIFTLFSMGPMLYLSSDKSIYYPLPYMALYYLPGFSLFRTPYRMLLVSQIALILMASLGMKKFIETFPRRKNTFTLIFMILALLENYALPIPLSPVDAPSIYYEIAKDSGDVAVLEIPIPPEIFKCGNATCVWGIPKLLYYQTIHEKPIVGGYISRITKTPHYAMVTLNETPLFNYLRYPQLHNHSSTTAIIQSLNSTLKQYNIGYVIIHPNFLRGIEFPEGIEAQYIKLFQEGLNQKGREVEGVVVFKVK